MAKLHNHGVFCFLLLKAEIAKIEQGRVESRVKSCDCLPSDLKHRWMALSLCR